MTTGLKTIIYPVRDAAAATPLYSELRGVEVVAVVTDADAVGLVQPC
jgi:hypothetical protein